MPFARSRMTRRHMLAGTGGVLGAIALAACGTAMPAESGEMPEKAEETKPKNRSASGEGHGIGQVDLQRPYLG